MAISGIIGIEDHFIRNLDLSGDDTDSRLGAVDGSAQNVILRRRVKPNEVLVLERFIIRASKKILTRLPNGIKFLKRTDAGDVDLLKGDAIRKDADWREKGAHFYRTQGGFYWSVQTSHAGAIVLDGQKNEGLKVVIRDDLRFLEDFGIKMQGYRITRNG